MSIKLGPAGLGPVNEAVKNLEKYSKLGLKACEIAFTYGVYIKKNQDIKMIREAAKKYDIKLSIHAPYWINLNSKEKMKIEKSKERILNCCEVGEKLGVYLVVFHPGYYAGISEDKTYENIKNVVLEMQDFIKQKGWKIKIAPETMGKNSVFGSFEQIYKLVKDTKCEFCLDFAHILARDKKVDYERIKKLFPGKKWHVHFTGIVYGEKGEKHHKKTEKEDWKNLFENLPKDKEIIIINEAPTPVEDAVEGLRIYSTTK